MPYAEFMSDKKIPVITIVGPTASGKTNLSVEVAKRFNGEIVSADSMQIYKGMDIGTAKPTIEEMQGIKHHLIDFVNPDTTFSVADYVKLAHDVIADIYSRGKCPIIVGGTGLYVSSLLNNIQFDETKYDEAIRADLYEFARLEGEQALWQMLKEIDPVTAFEVHQNNLPRVIRAIEIFKQTGRTMQEHRQSSRLIPSKYLPLKIGLTTRNRAALYDRINLRVDQMIDQGLVDEARGLICSASSKTAFQAIGYKELFPFVSGEVNFLQAVDKLKQETRRYAKRQLTWFRKDCEIHWFFSDEYEKLELLRKNVYNYIDIFLNMCYD